MSSVSVSVDLNPKEQTVNFMFCETCIVVFLYNKHQQNALFTFSFILINNLCMFRAGLLLIIMQWRTERGVQTPRNSEDWPKLSRIPSSVEYTSVTT
jgi:hypothetical protein